MKLLQAIDALVNDSKVAPKKIAGDAGIGYGYLMKAADDRQPEVQFQARWVAPVTKAAGNDVLINQIAQECGGIFVRLISGESHDAHTAKTLKEIGEYFTKLAEASENGYTHAEVDELESEWQDVVRAGLSHLKKLRAEAK